MGRQRDCEKAGSEATGQKNKALQLKKNGRSRVSVLHLTKKNVAQGEREKRNTISGIVGNPNCSNEERGRESQNPPSRGHAQNVSHTLPDQVGARE